MMYAFLDKTGNYWTKMEFYTASVTIRKEMNYNRNIIANKIKSDCFKHSTSETNCYIHTSKKDFINV